MEAILERKKKKLAQFKEHYILKNPLDLYAAKIQKLDYLTDQLIRDYRNVIEKKKNQLNILKRSPLFEDPSLILNKKKQKYTYLLGKLDALSPLKTLERGYSILKKEEKAITSIKDLNKDDLITIQMKDGSKEAIVQ